MDNRKETVRNFVITTTEYAENATVHGIKYIFEKVQTNIQLVFISSKSGNLGISVSV